MSEKMMENVNNDNDYVIESFFKSVQECPPEIEANVTGSIPDWLNGSLIRLGPGKWDLKDGFTLNHWLDGCAILVRFRFNRGQVFYSSRFVDSDAYRKMTTVHKPIYTEFGTRAYPDPSKSVLSRMLSRVVPSDLTDNDISNIYMLNDDLFVATESCNIWKIEAKTLHSLEKINLDKVVGVNLSSSHPLYSKSDGCYYNVGTSFLTGMRYQIYKVPRQSTVNSAESINAFRSSTIICTIPSSWKTCFSYVHSFAMSINYIIIIEQPLVVNAFKLATCTAKGKSLEECLEWRPEESTKFHIIDKNTGRELKVRYESDAFFFFHVINAYEQDGYIILDMIAYDDVSILEKYHIKRLRRNEWSEKSPPIARRFVFPLETRLSNDESINMVQIDGFTSSAHRRGDGAVWLTWEELAPPGFETPTVNSAYSGLKHRYIYGSGTFEKGYFANSVCKVDCEAKTVKKWTDTQHTYPGEAFFVPKPGCISEDDGVILTAVMQGDSDKGHYLGVLDATNMQEMARAVLPRATCQFPPTIHGIFLPGEDE
ncbi:carotenoid-cleaving dioxygenase, mitochondrial-like [Brevipalpus obovatus]|uniref:carotenoid-cleaving dioxygenase, mitochondrial-like n=1 Tax=Brevipalpus obovatus TaxID=246614 RepID=UPI003D9F8F90